MLHVVAFQLIYDIPIFAFDSLQNVFKNKPNLEKEQWWEFGLFSQTICNLMQHSAYRFTPPAIVHWKWFQKLDVWSVWRTQIDTSTVGTK